MARPALIAVAASLILLVASAASSAAEFASGIYGLELHKAALGVLSTLGPLYFAGLTLAVFAFVTGNDKTRTTGAVLNDVSKYTQTASTT